MRSALLSRLRRDESGVVLVFVAICMVLILGIAALAIDLGSWYQSQRQAQTAADAAALAGAQDLPVNAANAPADAQTYGNQDMGCSTSCTTVTTPYNGNANQIKVTVTITAPSYFGKLLGVTSATISASSVAQETPGSTACATPGNGCYAIFTSDSNCGTSNSPSYGVTFNGQGNTITGGVHSNGGINLSGGGQSLGPTTYGTGANCTVKTGGTGNTFASGPTAQDPIGWPDDYSKVLTACGGSGQVACTGPGGTPSYCTQALANFDFPTNPIATDNVYCAFGTGTPSDPSTWTGLINFNSGSFGAPSSPLQGTWIGGTIEVGATSYLATQTTTPTYPVFYAVGSGNCSPPSSGGVCIAQKSAVNGAMFAPNGTIQFNGSGGTANFLESKDVTVLGGNFTGNGPLDSGTGGSSSSGTGALVQ